MTGAPGEARDVSWGGDGFPGLSSRESVCQPTFGTVYPGLMQHGAIEHSIITTRYRNAEPETEKFIFPGWKKQA